MFQLSLRTTMLCLSLVYLLPQTLSAMISAPVEPASIPAPEEAAVTPEPALAELPPPTSAPSSEPAPIATSSSTSAACGSLVLRHIESGGIGYNEGYTTLGGVLSPAPTPNTAAFPYLDLRFHEFNNNSQAANASFGLRFPTSTLRKVIGIHAVYDFRNTEHHSHFNQGGFSLELLGKRLDLRINGYFPFGKKRHRISHCVFNQYIGNFFAIRNKYEVALTGANLEVGAVIAKFLSTQFYAAVGPYYYGGNVCQHAFGGRFRLVATYQKYLFLEGSVSRDQLFETRVQGLIGLRFPLGCTPTPNSPRQFPEELLTEPLQRHEIIVVDKNCKWKANF